jgi:hypothetical protein
MYRNSRGLARLSNEGARKTIERRAHGAVLTLTDGGVPKQHAHWFYDLRRKRLSVYGGLLRYIDTAIAQGQSNEEVKQVVEWLFAYIDEECPPPSAPALRLVA